MNTESLVKYYGPALCRCGISLPKDDNGNSLLFDEDGDGVLPSIRAQIMKQDAEAELPQMLLRDAVIQQRDFMSQRKTLNEVAFLASLHDNEFSMQIDLWKAMIDASRQGRAFTDVELEYYERRLKRARKDRRAAEGCYDNDVSEMAQAVHDANTLAQFGLLFDKETTADIDVLIGNVYSGHPTLIVGDKGIAKTQMARFVMKLYEVAPATISIKGDTTSDELIGAWSETVQEPQAHGGNPLIRAMSEGIPILLDEINFGNQTVIASLQDILLSKAGDKVKLPGFEDELTVRTGFAVIATANEASGRYKHRNTLDPAIRDRFEILERRYPDLSNNPVIRPSETLNRMALASVIDEDGMMSRHISRELLDAFVRAASITQTLYAIPARNAYKEFGEDLLEESEAQDDNPALSDCVTPRTLNRILSDSAKGNLPGKHLDLYLLEKMLRTLDQAGSTHNIDLTRRAMLKAGVNLYPRDVNPAN